MPLVLDRDRAIVEAPVGRGGQFGGGGCVCGHGFDWCGVWSLGGRCGESEREGRVPRWFARVCSLDIGRLVVVFGRGVEDGARRRWRGETSSIKIGRMQRGRERTTGKQKGAVQGFALVGCGWC